MSRRKGKVAIKRNLWTVSLSSVIHLSCSGYSTNQLSVRVRSSALLIMEHLLVDDVAASSLSAGNAARDNKKTRIIPRHIQLAYPASNTRLLLQPLRYVLFSVVSHHQGHGKLRFIASINSISLVLPPTTRRRKLLTFCVWFIWILYA